MRRVLASAILAAFGLLLASGALDQVLAQQPTPREWAAAQHKLGNNYVLRRDGDLADSIEKAIAAYEAALTVRTREALPHEWAITLHNFGLAYSGRVRGD